MNQRDANARASFEAILKANRWDAVTHRVYADWLEERGLDDEAAKQRVWTHEWQRSWDAAEARLTKFADDITEDGSDPLDDVKSVTLEMVVDAGKRAHGNREYSCLSGMGFAAEGMMEDSKTRKEFWDAWSIYTGIEVDDEMRDFEVFRCSC